MKRIWTRWLPAAAVPAAVAVAVLAGGASAVPPPSPSTPEQVLALVAAHTARQFSGTVEEKADLGLPSIPSQALGPATNSASLGSAATILELLTTSHTARVYADGPTKLRVQVMDQLAERDAVRNGNDAWTYDSKTNTATRVSVPAGGSTAEGSVPSTASPSVPAVTPDQLAQRFLTAAGTSTDISLGPTTTVAGHTAYTLVLTPKTPGTLVASVQIAVESQTGLPLSVDVYAKGQSDPALHTAFQNLDLHAPDASVFAFTPPAGATVKQEPLPAPKAGSGATPKASASPKPSQTGSSQASAAKSWDSVVVIPADKVPAGLTDSALVKQLASPVADGKLLSTSLVNVLVTNDGRVVAGAVPAATLMAAAK
ncbi:LolA family protein [Sinomonas susongensis]|uniref:LolA family protein n=1 Tax=Sinomonas susongensis TaxID=1324851 RepID=UPI001109C689|nr:DUF2092 domain-containing protein [Sinomonas susongensis]